MRAYGRSSVPRLSEGSLFGREVMDRCSLVTVELRRFFVPFLYRTGTPAPVV